MSTFMVSVSCIQKQNVLESIQTDRIYLMLICTNKCNSQIWNISYIIYIPSCALWEIFSGWCWKSRPAPDDLDLRGSYHCTMCLTTLTDVSLCMTSHSRDASHTSQSHQSQSNPSMPNNFNNSRAIIKYKLITVTQDSRNLQPREEKQATTGVLWVSVWRTHIEVSSLCFIFSQLRMMLHDSLIKQCGLKMSSGCVTVHAEELRHAGTAVNLFFIKYIKEVPCASKDAFVW